MSVSSNQTTLVSFFRVHNRKRLWAMKQMMVTQNRLKGRNGLVFHKMLGTGGGAGYSFNPDFGTYALLTVWDSPDKADSFESHSTEIERFRERSEEVYSIFLSPLQAKGMWSKMQPFEANKPDPDNSVVVAITRATLKISYYVQFWKRVGKISKAHIGMPGLIFTKGVGERPWIMQATFSIWNSVEEMAAFAHNKAGRHYEAIKTTRRLKGFREELYARFQPTKSTGTWFGRDPVGEALTINSLKKEIGDQVKLY